MSAAAADQISAREVDLFANEADEDLVNAVKTARVSFTGKLRQDADVRVRNESGSDGVAHLIPVLCVEIEVDSPVRHVVAAQQPYTDATRKQAEAAAEKLKRGQLVTVVSPLLDMRVYLPNAEVRIDPQPMEQETSA